MRANIHNVSFARHAPFGLTCRQTARRFGACRHHSTCRSTRNADRLISCSAAQGVTQQKVTVQEATDILLGTIKGAKARGKSGLTEQQIKDVNRAVRVLERNGGIQGPTASPLLEGRWKLLFTTRPGSASPIQKAFIGIDAFTVYQEISGAAGQGRVNNVVDFGPNFGFLKVEAEASTDSNPREGFVPRQKPGLKIFGRSSSKPPSGKNIRIDFQFDTAGFALSFLPFKIPYPVPFKLLGDETKGWIDITYLSEDGQLRLTRGNKGTLFVLQSAPSAKQRLLDAITSKSSNDQQVEALIQELQGSSPEQQPASSAKSQGKWKLLWSKQAQNANYLQKALANKVNNFQVLSQDADGQPQVENVVQLGPFLSVKAGGSCKAQGSSRTLVQLNDIRAELGPLRIPLPRGNSSSQDGAGAFVDWLYLDEDLRITQGSKGSLFIHTKS